MFKTAILFANFYGIAETQAINEYLPSGVEVVDSRVANGAYMHMHTLVREEEAFKHFFKTIVWLFSPRVV